MRLMMDLVGGEFVGARWMPFVVNYAVPHFPFPPLRSALPISVLKTLIRD